MSKPEFVYVIYIASTPEKVWNAFTDPQVTPQFWHKINVSDWKPGSRWEHVDEDRKDRTWIVGKVVESDPPKRLVLTWAYPEEESNEQRHSQVMIEIEPYRDVVRVRISHERLDPDSRMLRDISGGWPLVLSNLKSFLELEKAVPPRW